MQENFKKQVGWAALKYVQPNSIVGVGTGSTAGYFIEALSSVFRTIQGVVSSSEASSTKLKRLGIQILDLNSVSSLDTYVDGADEINKKMQMIKGKGAALTKEKIIASVARTFVCIVDASKRVDRLGNVPLPIEIIPMARTFVMKEIVRLGGFPIHRRGIITDNNNVILDVYDLKIKNAVKLEEQINNIPGVVTVGLFAKRRADIALIGSRRGVQIIHAKSNRW